MAGFGDRAIAVAARHADCLLIDLVSPGQVEQLRAKLAAACHTAGTRQPRLAAWLPAAVHPGEESYTQILSSIAGYLTVRGYAEMFTAAGYDHAVELAQAGADPQQRLAALPRAAAHMVGLVGDQDAVRTRLRDYVDAGLDEIGILPATRGDPNGKRTLSAMAALAAEFTE